MLSDKKEMRISYPCSWSYKIIGQDKDMVKEAITAITAGKYTLNYSNASRTGKYHSWSLTLEVNSEAERNTLFKALKNHPQIKIVI
ncbi:MAG: DUF493 domain-containing protein [Deltaproteobacteria bacterium]|nr:DUF493 domain-containing protein [Deltaproteobacteria bacterium]